MISYYVLKYIVAILGGIYFARYAKARFESENKLWNIKAHVSYWKDAWFLIFVACTGLLKILMGVMRSPKHTIQMLISLGLSACFWLMCYYLLLIIFLPMIRQKIHSRTTAMFWLLPLYLYLLSLDLKSAEAPSMIIPFSETGIWTLFGIWFIGFLTVFIWKIVSHLKFRSYVLQNTSPIPNTEIKEIWRKALYEMDIKKPFFDIVISPNVSTPMTIGLFRRSLIVVLPERIYSEEELSLIYKHELTHIARSDHWAKFFLTLCTAACWFNPLMWFAMKKCTEDLELSCDETVLIHSNDIQKRQYAELILKTAGDERGFTTCLSVKAKSLHYRLTNILSNRTKYSGAILAGIIFALLIITNKHVAFAYGYTTGKEILFENQAIENYTFGNQVRLLDSDTYVRCNDSAALLEYLEQLPICEITSNYTFVDDSLSVDSYQLGISYSKSGCNYYLQLSDTVLYLYTYTLDEWEPYIFGNHSNAKPEYYYLPSGVDFDYIYSLLDI